MSFTHGSYNMFITVWLFISPFIFQFFFLVYTNSIHSLGALQLFGISLEYDMWHTVAWILDILTNIHQDGNSDIFISRGWYSEVYASYFILILYDCALMSTHFHCIYFLYTVFTVCWHSHMGFMYTKCILMLHITPQTGAWCIQHRVSHF